MHLTNLKREALPPFVYSLKYNPTIRAIEFCINPDCIPIINAIPSETFQSHWGLEKLGLSTFEGNILKNFGYENCSLNNGIQEGLLSISFPVKASVAISENTCFACRGTKKDWKDASCSFCKGTGKELLKKNNLDAICASMFVLTRYLNWRCIMRDDVVIPENKFGRQHIFLEVDPKAGIGGECSPYFFEQIKKIEDSVQETWLKNMFELDSYLDGNETFPGFEMDVRKYDFRCDVSESGRIYVQVPGQNSCSIHMHHSTDFEFTCHNIDTVWQQVGLLSGFALIVGAFFKQNRSS
jgi:hypothetical protein